MEWISEELDSIWDLVQEFVVQISLIKWKEHRRTNTSVSTKDWGKKGKEKKKRKAACSLESVLVEMYYMCTDTTENTSDILNVILCMNKDMKVSSSYIDI